MKTVLLANKFFHRKGGAEAVLFQERDYLLEQGVEVVDFSMEDERNQASSTSSYFVPQIDYHSDQVGKLQKVKNALSFIHSPEAVKRISNLVEDKSPDIAHLHNIYHQLTPSIIPVLKRAGVKVVLTLHDTKLACPSYLMLNQGEICEECQGRKFYKAATSGCQSSLFKGVLLGLEGYWHAMKGSYDLVDKFFAPSQFIADMMSRYRIPSDKIEVLRNGINTNDFLPTYEDHGYVLYLGRISKEKGIETLLAAHAGVKQDIPMKIVGTGPLMDSLAVRSVSGVDFKGYKTGDELRDIVKKCSCVVVPSEWYENCSMVVLEAMALGKPVIGARIGGIPEQVEDGVTGILFSMGNIDELTSALARIMVDPEKRIRMGKAAREKLELEYSEQSHNEGLMKIYNEILGS